MTEQSAKRADRKMAAGIIFLGITRLMKSLMVIISIALITKKFGATLKADVFFMAQLWPILMANLSRMLVNISFIPVFVDVSINKSKEEVWKFASNALNVFFVGSVVLAAAYFILAFGITETLISLDFATIQKISSEFLLLTVILLPVIVLSPVFAFWESILYSRKDYFLTGCASLMVGIFEIGAILLFADRYGTIAIALGMVVGHLFQLLLVLPKFIKEIKFFGASLGLRSSGSKKVFSRMLPVLYGISLGQLIMASDWILASILGEGKVTSLICASKLAHFVPSFFATTAIIPLLGRFSEFVVDEDYDSLKKTMLRAIRFVFLVILPFCVWFALSGGPVSEFLFLRGKFVAEAIYDVKWVLIFLIPNIFFQSINSVFRQIILAMGRTRFVAIETTTVASLNIFLSIMLMLRFDIFGLALGTSIASVSDTIFLVWYFQKRAGRFAPSGMKSLLSKVVVASLIMAGGVWCAYRYVGQLISLTGDLGQVVHLVSSALVGGIVYLTLAFLFKALNVKDPLGNPAG